MLFKRYASPMVILDKMILTHRLCDFVNEFVKIQNEETNDETSWEYWLHRGFDMSYQAFLDNLNKGQRQEKVMSEDEIEATLKNSMGMLESFCPS